MHFLKTIKQVLRPRQLAGAEITLAADGKLTIHAVLLSRQKNKATISSSLINGSVEELKSMIPAGVPVSLVLNGRGILHRKFESSDKSPQQMLEEWFPGVNPEEFYLQIQPAYSGHYLSVIRRQTIEQVFEQLGDLKKQVITVSPGPFSVIPVINLFQPDCSEICFEGHLITFRNRQPDEYKSVQANNPKKPFYIAGEGHIQETILLPFAAAFQQMVFDEEKTGLEIHTVTAQKEEFYQQQLFKQGGLIFLGFLFLLLALNYIFYTVQFTRNQEFREKLAVNSNLIQKLHVIRKDVEQKNAFLKETGWIDGIHNSFLADRIASEIPAGIQLYELTIHPVIMQGNSNQKLQIDHGKVRITGTSKNAVELNSWINTMKKKDWIKEISIENYLFNSKEGTGTFKVLIEVTNESNA